jgi:alginate O-acetyltransferase complex protein AlgI
MVFNSFQFAIFFIVVYLLYLVLKHRWQNWMLLAASYFFYGSWDWRFLSLIWLSTLMDYIYGIQIGRADTQQKKKFFLVISIICNLAILGFFKYFNFFAENLISLLSIFHLKADIRVLNIILPVGISFYTFQSMSYTIDVYRQRLKPCYCLRDFALFIAFFPQLVAGPIERAENLLPQVMHPRKIQRSLVLEGAYLILWGLFQKVFVADNLAGIADPVFSASPPYKGFDVLMGLYAFAFQIYCDFAGYSNIARGVSKCMGFELMNNFHLPYFAANPSDFWKRWHISLSTWLKDYLYIPLGGNRHGLLKTFRNLFVTMLLGGLWHGATWTFVFWGIYHGILLMLHRLYLLCFPGQAPAKSKMVVIVKVFCFFHIICLGWLLFRAQSLEQVFQMLSAILTDFGRPVLFMSSPMIRPLVFYTIVLIGIELVQAYKRDLLIIYNCPFYIQAVIHGLLVYLIIINASPGKTFIYFQF